MITKKLLATLPLTILIATSAYADDATVQAIKDLQQSNSAHLDALQKQLNFSINSIFFKIDNKGNSIASGILPQLWDQQIDNIYSRHNKISFKNLAIPQMTQKNAQQLNRLISNDLEYNLIRSSDGKKADDLALSQFYPIDKFDMKQLNQKVYTFGGLSYTNASTSAPSVNDLFGSDGYDDAAQNRAKAFIRSISQDSSNTTITIPPKPSSLLTNFVQIILPNNDGITTKTVNISTQINPKKNSNGKLTNSEYDAMIDYLNSNKIYQSYKKEENATNALNSIYMRALLQPLQKRIRDPQTGQSLLEQEKNLAEEGLTAAYYDKLKNMSATDVNLELIHTQNKIVYFLQRLEQQKEYENFLQTINSINTNKLLAQQKSNTTVQPLAKLIDNRCWFETDSNRETCQNPTSINIHT